MSEFLHCSKKLVSLFISFGKRSWKLVMYTINNFASFLVSSLWSLSISYCMDTENCQALVVCNADCTIEWHEVVVCINEARERERQRRLRNSSMLWRRSIRFWGYLFSRNPSRSADMTPFLMTYEWTSTLDLPNQQGQTCDPPNVYRQQVMRYTVVHLVGWNCMCVFVFAVRICSFCCFWITIVFEYVSNKENGGGDSNNKSEWVHPKLSRQQGYSIYHPQKVRPNRVKKWRVQT